MQKHCLLLKFMRKSIGKECMHVEEVFPKSKNNIIKNNHISKNNIIKNNHLFPAPPPPQGKPPVVPTNGKRILLETNPWSNYIWVLFL